MLILSSIVALVCVLASARRLAWAIAPVGLEPRLVIAAIEGDRTGRVWAGLKREVMAGAGLDWERELVEAMSAPSEAEREALLSEGLLELEIRADRWRRVPRVCASVATSAGFLCACISLLRGLSLLPGDDIDAAIHSGVTAALGALSVGIAAASFCAAVHMRAARVLRGRMSAIGRLMDVARDVATRTPETKDKDMASAGMGGMGEGAAAEPGRE